MIARIAGIVALSPSIKRIALTSTDGALLPPAAAGAHIVLTIPGPARSWKNAYSLVSPPGARQAYEIIVRRVEKSRGGSAWLHGHAQIGQEIDISLPANLFPIAKNAQKHFLLSAGIGITPFLSYLPAFRAENAPFEWHHCSRPEDVSAFAALLPDQKNITLHTGRNMLNLPKILARQKLNTHIYVCGPAPFMDAAIATAQNLGFPKPKIHSESFGGPTGGAPFRVRLARAGLTLDVGPEESLLDALEAAGLAPPSLCRGGACGECELPVLAGTPEHHDHYLPPEIRAAGTAIMTCVSRAQTPELVLDF
jgi:ferredoxin-NADP reductase